MVSLLTLALTPRARPYLAIILVLSFIFITYNTISTFSSHEFQFPSLLPSKQTTATNHLLEEHLQKLYSDLRRVCPLVPEPIYTEPGLTPAQEKRYAHLKNPKVWSSPVGARTKVITKPNEKYLLTTTIRQIEGQLPDLLNTLLTLVLFLGPSHLSFSILEGPSDDCTPDAFEAVLKPMLLGLGVSQGDINLVTRESKIDFANQNRIEVLAGLRNKALSPLWNEHYQPDVENEQVGASRVDDHADIAAVVFFNDVYLRASDVLELLHQHVVAGDRSGMETGITTGIDWYDKDPDYYYDVWVGRTVSNGSQIASPAP
jgi:alpha-1,3-mannosyltransferase